MEIVKIILIVSFLTSCSGGSGGTSTTETTGTESSADSLIETIVSNIPDVISGDTLSPANDTESEIPSTSLNDTDGDGVNNSDENLIGTDPLLLDTDGDGTSDGQEDYDGDLISNAIESNSTSPDITDFDSDGLPDITTEYRASCLTPPTKAAVFNGTTDQLTSQANLWAHQPLRRGSINAPEPWAAAVIFKLDENVSEDAVVWSQTGGTFIQSAKLYLKAEGDSHRLSFYYGKSGHSIEFQSTELISGGSWQFIYIDYDGGATGGDSSNANDYYSRFRIKSVNPSTSEVTDVAGSWTIASEGYNDSISGQFLVGAGYNGTDNFDGEIAQLVTTTLRNNPGSSNIAPDAVLPGDKEISLMTLDPSVWMIYGKIGQPFRRTAHSGDATDLGFTLDHEASSLATQVWLFGDGVNGTDTSIYNQVNRQINYGELQKDNETNLVFADISASLVLDCGDLYKVDSDSDGLPDTIDTDDDDDGYADDIDRFPVDPLSNADKDNDGIADVDDSDSSNGPAGDIDSDGLINLVDNDIDGDGVNNTDESILGLNVRSADTSGSGVTDANGDSDFDGISNAGESNAASFTFTDDDADGIADVSDQSLLYPIMLISTDSAPPASMAGITWGPTTYTVGTFETTVIYVRDNDHKLQDIEESYSDQNGQQTLEYDVTFKGVSHSNGALVQSQGCAMIYNNTTQDRGNVCYITFDGSSIFFAITAPLRVGDEITWIGSATLYEQDTIFGLGGQNYTDFCADTNCDNSFSRPATQIVESCPGWSCSNYGAFCPENVPGSHSGGYCCNDQFAWVAGTCE